MIILCRPQLNAAVNMPTINPSNLMAGVQKLALFLIFNHATFKSYLKILEKNVNVLFDEKTHFVRG